MKKIGHLIGAIILCEGAGLLGTLVTRTEIPEWYATEVVKPFFAPPNWVFGPVWTILYLLMGISLYLILKERKSRERRLALYTFGSQLFLNAIWTPVFFGLHAIEWALLVIITMWVLIIATMIRFYRVRPLAAQLLIPYLFWVTFAIILNTGLAVLN